MLAPILSVPTHFAHHLFNQAPNIPLSKVSRYTCSITDVTLFARDKNPMHHMSACSCEG